MKSWYKNHDNHLSARHLERKKELMITSSVSGNVALVKRIIVIYGIIIEHLRKHLL